ncbi:ATP-binding protein [Acidobacteriota bacterium]
MDSERIRIVFKNLLGNDFKYSRMDSNPVEISIRADNNVLLAKIKDDRPDIPEEDIPQLFEPFFRVDRFRLKKTGGHGLGLRMHTGEKLRYQIMRKEAYQ